MVSARECPRKTAEECWQDAGQKEGGDLQSATNRAVADVTQRFGLRKKEILRGYGAFASVISKRKQVQDSGLRCYYSADNTIPPWTCAVGFAVKGARKAVTRNAVKRLLRETLRLQKPLINETCKELCIRLECVFVYGVKEKTCRPAFCEMERATSAVIRKMLVLLCAEYGESPSS